MADVEEIQEIKALRQILTRHNYKYYVENDPEISDQEFDALMERLVNLEKNIQRWMMLLHRLRELVVI